MNLTQPTRESYQGPSTISSYSKHQNWDTGLRRSSAGIPLTLLLRFEAIGLTLGFYCFNFLAPGSSQPRISLPGCLRLRVPCWEWLFSERVLSTYIERYVPTQTTTVVATISNSTLSPYNPPYVLLLCMYLGT